MEEDELLPPPPKRKSNNVSDEELLPPPPVKKKSPLSTTGIKSTITAGGSGNDFKLGTQEDALGTNNNFSIQPEELKNKSKLPEEKETQSGIDFSPGAMDKLDQNMNKLKYGGKQSLQQAQNTLPSEYLNSPELANQKKRKKTADDISKAIIKKQADEWTKKHGDSYLSGIGLQMTYAASSLAKGLSNVVPSMVYASDKINKALTGKPLLSEDEKSELLDKTSESANLGLNPDYRGSNVVMGAIGGLLEFVPAALAAESTAGASFYLNGVGHAYKEVQDAKKNGAKFDNGAEDLYVQGKGLTDMFLMTKLNAHSLFPTLPSSLRNAASREASIDALNGLLKSGEPLTSEALVSAFKDSAIKMSDNIKAKGIPFLKELSKGYAKTAGDLSALTISDALLKKSANKLSGDEVLPVEDGSVGENIGHILTTDAPLFAALGARQNLGLLFDKSPYRNEVVESLKNNHSPEAIDAIKQNVESLGAERGWTKDDIEGTSFGVDKIADAVKKIPGNLSESKYNQALDVVLGKENLLDQLGKVNESNRSLDPALVGDGTPEQKMLTAKLEQSDDKLREISTGKKVKYSEDPETGEYFKQLGGDGKLEPISKDRFELEQVENKSRIEVIPDMETNKAPKPDIKEKEANARSINEEPVKPNEKENNTQKEIDNNYNQDDTNQKNDKVSEDFSKLVHKNIQSEEVSNTLNNIERETGRSLDANEKEYQTTKRLEAIQHGADVVEKAKEEFGDDYASKLIDYLDKDKTVSVENKSLITISLELDLEKRILDEPQNKLTLEKQLKLVRDISTKQQRSAAIATGYGILRQLARVGYDVSKVTSEFFSPKERESKRGIEKAIESDADAINKEAERKVKDSNDFISEDVESAIAKGVESQLRDIYEKLPTKRRDRADKAVAALERIQKKLRSKTYDAAIGIPIAIIDAGITTIKAAIKAGVSIADAIELGIKNIKDKHGKKWDKENEFRQDMLEGFSAEKIDVKEGSKLMSEDQKRESYINKIAKDIERLDDQIAAGEKKVVKKEDKYAQDEEINELRKIRADKKKELEIIDPVPAEEAKLKTALKATEKSLKEYQRKINEQDFEPGKKDDVKIQNEELSKLQADRDKARQEYEDLKKQNQPEKTNSERLVQAKERVRSRMEEIKQEIINKKRELKSSGKKVQADAELISLQAEEKALLNLRDKYLPKSIDPASDAKKIDTLSKKLLNEIEDINRQINQGEKDQRAAGNDPYENEQITKLKAEKKARLDTLETIDPSPKAFIQQALIEKGFGREITVTVKDAEGNKIKEKREVLDWKKLAGEEGSVDRIRDNVEQALRDKGYSEGQILRMQDAYIKEYNDLRASIIEKSLNELQNRNTPKEPIKSKTSAKRLAELYNFGLFEKESDTYDYLLNNALGLSGVGQEAFFKAKTLGKALSDLYQTKVDGRTVSEFGLKHAVREINQQIEALLSQVAWEQSNGVFKATTVVKEYMGMAQRAMLQSVKQFIENPLSGAIQRTFTRLGFAFDKVDTKALEKNRTEIAKAIYEDTVRNSGLAYGDVTTPFLTRSRTEEWLNRQSTSKVYHTILSSFLGKAYLEGADSMHKSSLTEKYFTYNLIKVLTDKNNPDRMSKQEAISYVSENLTGQRFQDAKEIARQIIDKANTQAGKNVIPDNKESVVRIATDVVKDSLLQDKKLTLDEIEASYSAAYKAAGFDLGHEANNPISAMVSNASSSIEAKIQKSIKEKKWNEAAAYTFTSILSRNILNPFVGGGTNWIVLTLQKSGGDIISPWFDYAKKRDNPLDLSTEAGIRNIEKSLMVNLKSKNTNTRVMVGAMASLLTYAAVKSTGSDDDISKWLKKNDWARKYFNTISPQMLVLMLAAKDKKMGEYFANILNIRVGDFNEGSKIVKGIQATAEGTDSGTNKGAGIAGDLIGSRLSTPVIPWRFTRDLQNIGGGLGIVKKPHTIDYQTSGFFNGYFKAGLIDYLGLRPEGNKNKPKTPAEMDKLIKDAFIKINDKK